MNCDAPNSSDISETVILLPRMPIMFTTTSSMAIQMGFIRGCMSVCMNGFMRSPPQARLRPGAMHPYRLSGS